jgi:hypothetical protein
MILVPVVCRSSVTLPELHTAAGVWSTIDGFGFNTRSDDDPVHVPDFGVTV